MLQPLEILKKSSGLTGIGFIGTGMNLLAGIYAANRLGPAAYGQVAFVLLWVSYATLVKPGFFEAGQRELIRRLATGDVDRARNSQNAGLSADLLWMLLPGAALLCAGPWFPDAARRHGFLLAPLVYWGAALTRYLGAIHLAHRNLRMVVAAAAVRSFVQPALLVLLVVRLGFYGMLLTPAVIEAGICVLYRATSRGFGLAWRLDFPLARTLLRAGFPLALAGVIYWVYRLAGTTWVAVAFPAHVLGAYSFASKIIDTILRLFADFAAVLTPALWAGLAQAGRMGAFRQDCARVCLFLTVLSGAVCGLLQAAAAPLVLLLLPKFREGIAVIEILALNVVLLTVSIVPSLVLDSATVNKQWRHLGIWTAAVAVNYVANYLTVHSGGGVRGIAWNDIWIQAAVVVAIYAAAHSHMFGTWAAAARVYATELLLMAACLGLYGLLTRPYFSLPQAPSWREAIPVLLLRGAPVLAVWAGLFGLLYKHGGRVVPETAPQDVLERQIA